MSQESAKIVYTSGFEKFFNEFRGFQTNSNNGFSKSPIDYRIAKRHYLLGKLSAPFVEYEELK